MNTAALFHKYATFHFGARNQPELRPGDVYRASGPREIVETAEILSVRSDWQGIPHVCFRHVVTRANLARTEARRTLTLSCFQSRFTEALSREVIAG